MQVIGGRARCDLGWLPGLKPRAESYRPFVGAKARFSADAEWGWDFRRETVKGLESEWGWDFRWEKGQGSESIPG
jgi:hypothetical protein